MPTEFFHCEWVADDFLPEIVLVGEPSFQTFFELVALLLTCCLWAAPSVDHSLAILGDNVAALQMALSLKGRGPNLRVARELAWRRARLQWNLEVGHLPAESNLISDAFCRQAASCTEKIPFPARALGSAKQVQCHKISELWHLQ